MIHVCSLSRLHDTVDQAGAAHVITLITEGTEVERPAAIAPHQHLYLAMNDIAEPLPGMTPPGADHIETLIGYIESWDRADPIVIHCWAGISRSTAAAFTTMCLLYPEADEYRLAHRLRRLSPTATPNPRIVALADQLLGRSGRMIDAVRQIGRGAMAFEGTPFQFTLEDDTP
ncbi:MAG: tyrosine protein phosphatase [Pseudomonadota bacterium]